MHFQHLIAHQPSREVELMDGGIQKQRAAARLIKTEWGRFAIAANCLKDDGCSDLSRIDPAMGLTVSGLVAAHAPDLQNNVAFAGGSYGGINPSQGHGQRFFAEDVLASCSGGLDRSQVKL